MKYNSIDTSMAAHGRKLAAARQRTIKDRKRAAGLVQVNVWVPAGTQADVRSFANKLIGSEDDE